MSLFLLPKSTISAANTVLGKTYYDRALGGSSNLCVEAIFNYGAGGTTAKAYVQTTFDNGATWVDIMCFAFATAAASKIMNVLLLAGVSTPVTPTDGTLANDTVANGIFGQAFRVKLVSTGTYSGLTNLALWSQGMALTGS